MRKSEGGMLKEEFKGKKTGVRSQNKKGKDK
jgi:hypothetical protein